MQSEPRYRQLLEDFYQTLGFNQANDETFSFTVNEQFDIDIGVEKSCEAIVFVSYIASLSDHSDRQFLLRTLLEANFANRVSPYGSLGLAPESDDVVFSFKIPLHDLDLPILLQLFEHVIETSKQWCHKLQRLALNHSESDLPLTR